MFIIQKKFLKGIFFTLGILPYMVCAQAPSLSYLAEKAIEKNYDLANKQLDVQSDRETQKTIKGTYIPRLGASGKYAYVTGDFTVDLPTATLPLLNIPLFEGTSTFPTSANLWMADITASMVLFSGTKVPKLNKAIEQKIQGATIMLEKDRQEIIDQVAKAYDQLALLKQVQVVLDESRKRLDEESKTAKKAFEYGLITSFELNKIDVAQATLDAKQQEFLGKKDLLISQLHQLTGVDKATLQLINTNLETYLVISLEGSIENRPEINALDAAIKANTYKAAAEKAHWFPQAQAVASTNYVALTNANFKTPYQNPITNNNIELGADKLELFPSFFVGVGFKWDFFDGLKGKREVAKANIEIEKAQNTKQQAIELLNLNLENAKMTYQVSNKQVETGLRRKTTAEKALTIAAKEYKIGLIKPSERIVAENDYQQAALDYLQTIFDQRRAAINYLKATGTLTIDKLK